MKYLAILMFLAWCMTGTTQEKISKNLTVRVGQKIIVESVWADMKIIGNQGSELKISADVSINNNEANDHFELVVEEKSDRVIIEARINDLESIPEMYTIKLDGRKYYFRDKSKAKEFRRDNPGADYFSAGHDFEITVEITLPRSNELEVSSTYGDVDISDGPSRINVRNTYGHIDADFASWNGASNDISLLSTYAFVDVTLPAVSHASLALKSNYGEIFTDMDLEMQDGSIMKQFHTLIVARLNRGGGKLAAESTYNNVYIRKS